MTATCQIILMTILVALAGCSSNQSSALASLGASRMYGDAKVFGLWRSGRPKSDKVGRFEDVQEISLGSHRDLRDEQLINLRKFPCLEELDLKHTNLTDSGIAHLAACRNLRSLSLRFVPVTDDSASVFASLPRLRELDLWGTEITDETLRELAALRELQSLTLHDTAVTDAGLEYLESYPALEEVALARTEVTSEGKERLRSAIPGITIYPEDFTRGSLADPSIPSSESGPRD